MSEEYQKLLRKYRKLSDRHVLRVEANLSHQDKCKIFHYADKLRKAGNELTAIMKNNYEQLIRTKQYRKLKVLYGKTTSTNNQERRKSIIKQMERMQKQYNVTWDFCRRAMIPIGQKYELNSVFALTKAEDIWRGVEKCLFSKGKTLHFAKRDNLPNIRAKQLNRGIVVVVKDNQINCKIGTISFNPVIKDKFELDETNAIVKYLVNSDEKDSEAIKALITDGTIISTYRPCYASLVCEKIRGNLKVYVCFTIEGTPKPKFKSDGTLRHKYGTGIVGCDIGTQTIAYTSDSEVGLKNLAERGSSIKHNECQERLIYRAMDRSRRAINPQNYNTDGTVKSGPKHWSYSNRYKKLKRKHAELCRVNAINRRLATNEDVNHIRTLGNIFVTEPKNAKKLQMRAKNTTTNKEGKINRKKRFGKSIKNRCPGYFQKQVEVRFKNTGGAYIEVPTNYRASQYDHTNDSFEKKELSNRFYRLSDGSKIQRDWYSSFLLYNIDLSTREIDKNKCKENFYKQYAKQNALIDWIKANKIKIYNSGIKI
ncbi:MAG: hypothetical protein UH542_00935 [Bacteroidales bacterium]|nr:hypothetical protein [Bacteroidales bacterium]